MNIIEAIVLGLVQGLTEFIPVSSSGHLVLAQRFLGVHSFTFDVLLNFGTLLALVTYYRRRLADLVRDILARRNAALAAKLIAATIPTFIFGFFLGDIFEAFNENIGVVIFMLAAVGALMVVAGSERAGKLTADVNRISWLQAALVAAAQVVALVPGTSRSGITILAGLQQRLSYQAAAEFSFMLAIPTILGAFLRVLVSEEGIEFISNQPGLLVAGNIASFVSGLAAVSFLIRLLGRHGLRWFGVYRLVLAGLLIALLSAKIL